MISKIGVIGTGAIGREHIARLHGKLAGSSVVAVDDIDAGNARAAERLCPEATVHATVAGSITRPTARDGYFAAVTSDACVEAKRGGEVVPIATKRGPAFHA